MPEHHHDLSNEFPEFKEKIHQLKLTDHHFTNLYNQYQAVDKEIFRIEEEIETPSDEFVEELKKKRLTLKDELYAILKR